MKRRTVDRSDFLVNERRTRLGFAEPQQRSALWFGQRPALAEFLDRQLVRQRALAKHGVVSATQLETAQNDADVARIVAGPASKRGEDLDTWLLRAVDELHRDNGVADGTWSALAAKLTLPQFLDTLVTVGGFRSATYAINSAGVQLDANMADFRFPAALR